MHNGVHLCLPGIAMKHVQTWGRQEHIQKKKEIAWAFPLGVLEDSILAYHSQWHVGDVCFQGSLTLNSSGYHIKIWCWCQWRRYSFHSQHWKQMSAFWCGELVVCAAVLSGHSVATFRHRQTVVSDVLFSWSSVQTKWLDNSHHSDPSSHSTASSWGEEPEKNI